MVAAASPRDTGNAPNAEVDTQELKAIKSKFRGMDRNEDGHLSFDEIKSLLKSLDNTLSERQLQALFCEIDGNHNGVIEIDEFVDFVFKEGKRSKLVVQLDSAPMPKPRPLSNDWKRQTVATHNEKRALHGCPPLEWSDECYVEAQKQADICQAERRLFKGCRKLESGRVGQNAFWSASPGTPARSVIESWYNEMQDPGYNFDEPGYKSGIGSFSQVVWKATTHVAMAASSDGCFVVAIYTPAGNNTYPGVFDVNVPRPLSGPQPLPSPKARSDTSGQATPSPSSTQDAWTQATLAAHNRLRARHGCPPLQWSRECYIEAKKQADECQSRHRLVHGHLSGPSWNHGQNIFWVGGDGVTADEAVEDWYDEVRDPGYHFSKPGIQKGTGHFTQLIWKDTTHVGMAISKDGRYVVANYWPAGNCCKPGSYAANVLRPPDGRIPPRPRLPAPDAANSPGKQQERLEKKISGGGQEEVALVANRMTSELNALFKGCPFDWKKQVEAAFADGGATVTATMQKSDQETRLEVVIQTATNRRRLHGSW